MQNSTTSTPRANAPGGHGVDIQPGMTVGDILRKSGSSLDGVIAAEVNGTVVDLSSPMTAQGDIAPISLSDPRGLEILRHSTSHVLAHAVKDLFPSALPTIGPATAEGFYYDFYYPPGFTEEDLGRIEKRMREVIRENARFTREVMSRKDATAVFSGMGDTFKVEILEEIPEDTVSLYREGGFVDLCRGPHLPSAGIIPAFKLLTVAGSYWRGDEKKPMLQRIYGTAFPSEAELQAHLARVEEAKKRDHRRLGKDLDLFSIVEGVGPGFVLWHPKGALVRSLIEDFWREEHRTAGYDLIYSPHMARLDLWKKSGHTDFYRDNMYAPISVEDVEYQIRPMNCPFHIMIYKSRNRSYRDLPLRWAELGTVYRYERSGVLHGLMRVRGFTQDDAHIFLRPEQLEGEILRVLDFTVKMLGAFGFTDYSICLSTKPEKYVGTDEHWALATSALENSLTARGLPYTTAPGEGAFYGPKIDLQIRDVLGRLWQCTTIQVDFNLPERFDIVYAGDDNTPHRPIMVHRAILGSLERFFGILVEHYGGAFPLWLAPVQVMIIAINDDVRGYADSAARVLKEAGIRVDTDYRSETLGHKIREATLLKIPYMVIVGKKEMESGTLSVRERTGQEKKGVTSADLVGHLQAEIRGRVHTQTKEESSAKKKN